MNQRKTIRISALLLCLALCVSLLSGVTVFAAGEIWTEVPTGWRDSSHVLSEKSPEGYTLNWGVRGEPALFLSGDAGSCYAASGWNVGEAWGLSAIADYDGGTGPDTFSPNDTCTRAQIVTFLHHAEALLN